jgi:EAL and modified HD-GYP domain-containing signal transduction protein
VLVSRQPVLDRYGRTAGYRIAYAFPDSGPAVPEAQPTLDAMSLFDTVLSVIGLEWLVGDSTAHLPISRDMLLALGTPPVRPDRVVLRIGYDDALDPVLQPMLQTAVERGYTLELDSLPGPGFDVSLVDTFGLVEFDFAKWSASDITAVLPDVLSRYGRPLAVGLPDHEARDAAEALGFELFTGPFFGTPKVVRGRKIPTGDIRTLASIVQLQGEEVSLEQVVEVIDRDLGLSIRLLRYINSAYFGMAHKVGSIHDAAMKLGSRGVARWALTVTISGAPDISSELALTALTRARLCELLGDGSPDLDSGELFTIGLLSAADAVFGRPLDTIIPELPLSERVIGALLRHEGPAGEVLHAALAYERGELGHSMLERLGRGHGRSYRTALGWARETLVNAA